jgi:soluble cytochrome b562
MKSIGRPLKTLRAQITDASKKDENLQMINDMQRGAVMAKGAKLSEKVLEKGADAKAKAEMAKDFRRHMLALTKTLLEVETLLLDDKLEEAKAELEKAVKMRDEGHKKMGVDDE